MRTFSGWLTVLACAGVLAACGGGGGSAGANSNGVTPTPPSKAASVSLVASAATIDSSGADGTEVTLTAIVKDANSNALAGETISFSADSGIISNTNRISNSSGAVIEKLSVKDSSKPRVITITASDGTVTSAPVTVTVVVAAATVPTLVLSSDSGQLASSGASGTEVNLTVQVKDSGNNVLPGVTVGLTSDSGSLVYSNTVTDARGTVSAKLGTGGDPTSRKITVTATSTGAKAVTLPINVAGNKLTINSSSTIKVGASTDISVKLVDSAGNALVNKTVTFSSAVNTIGVKGGGAAVTDSAGQLVLSYMAQAAGSDTIIVKAVGETATAAIAVSTVNFTVNAADANNALQTLAAINTCQKVLISDYVGSVPQAGTVALSISRGTAYSDAVCGAQLLGPLTLTNGTATGYVQAVSPGVATLTATTNGLSTQGSLEFVAPYTAAATVTVQADPAVLGINTPGSTAQQSTLRAIVLDGTPKNNLVKNAQVSFSIVNDPSGGTLTQPSVVTTGSDGTASIGYIAGTSGTPVNGVSIQAQLQGASQNTGVVLMTVAKKSVSISAGTGNTILTPDATSYQVDYSVFVTDSAGNPVSGVNLTSSVRPRYYYKGRLFFAGTQGPWAIDLINNPPLRCLNEDVNSDNILQPGEDTNGDGILTPGNAGVTVTPIATTDANGEAIVSLRYPRDRANWVDIALTIRGQVSGTEALYIAYTRLPFLGSDYTVQATPPPGYFSPYGSDTSTCTNTN